MSFLESLKISRKSRTSLALVQGMATRPFSFLLSPFKTNDQFRTRSRSKQRISEQSFSATRYKNIQPQETISLYRPKKRTFVKACTIDLSGINKSNDKLQARRKTNNSIKMKNSKSLKTKKSKGEDTRLTSAVSKYLVNGSLQMRISSLGIRTGTFQNDLQTIYASPKRLNSSQLGRDKQIRLMNSQPSKLREKQRARNIKSAMLQDLKPWESIAIDTELN